MASPRERAGFGMLSSFAATVVLSRAINYVRERRRPAPRLRSWLRRVHEAPGEDNLRVHHFLPGIVIANFAGAAAILTRDDGQAARLSVPFGVGLGLTLDEIALLADVDNAYWSSERFSLAQAGIGAVGAALLAARLSRRAAALSRLEKEVAAEDG